MEAALERSHLNLGQLGLKVEDRHSPATGTGEVAAPNGGFWFVAYGRR